MKTKVSAFLIIILITANVFVFYDFLINILTYYISDEFYTKYLYRIYIRSNSERQHNESIYFILFWISFLSKIGWSLAISLILGIIGFFFKSGKTMLSNVLKSLGIVLFVTILFNIFGYLLSIVFPENTFSFYQQFPFQIFDWTSFNSVYWIDLFSYIGIIIGTLIAIIFLIRKIKADTK